MICWYLVRWAFPVKCGRCRSGQERLKEAAKHGFKRAIVPKGNAPKEPPAGLQIIAVTRLEQALDALFE